MSSLHYSIYALFAFLYLGHKADGQSLILTPSPLDTKLGSPIGLIYVPGAKIAPSQYRPLCEAIQSAFPQPLYVAIPVFVEGLATEFEIAAELPLMLDELRWKGLPLNSSVFMAGHSLGGAALQQFRYSLPSLLQSTCHDVTCKTCHAQRLIL